MEYSDSGQPIHRHQERKREFEFAPGDSENIEKIADHIEKHIGPVATVFHELVSDLVHIDIHIVEPTRSREWYTLVTSGMSDRPMQAPDEYPDLQFSELMICLPPDWPMSQDDWNEEVNYWPIRMLKFLARFPHEYETWLWAMHTIPNGDPPEPFAENTSMSAVLLLPPVSVSREFHTLKVDESKTIHFHAVVPLHADELYLKLREGAEALFDGFDKHGVSEVLNPGRPCVLHKKRRWFTFGGRGG